MRLDIIDRLTFILVLFLINVCNVSAETPSVESHPGDSILSKLDLVYLGIFDGPSVTHPSPYVPSPTGEPDTDSPVHLTNYVFAGYRLSERYTVGTLITSNLFPYEKPFLKLYDPALRISDRHFISSGDFNVFADVRLFLPATEASRNSHLVAGIQSFQMSSYHLSGTRWSFFAYSSIRYNFFTQNGSGNDLIIYFAPTIGYDLSSKVSANLFFGATASHTFKSHFTHLNLDEFYMGPGISWDITPNLSFSPALSISPTNPSLKSTSVFGFIVARLL
jgi:hypothetical protein